MWLESCRWRLTGTHPAKPHVAKYPITPISNSPLTFGNKKCKLLLAKTNQEMKDAVIEYLSEGFGRVEGCESIKLPRSMPLLVTSGYRFCKCRVLGIECVLAMAAETAVHTPRRVQKQLALVEAEMKMPVVFATRRLQPHDKARYVALRVPLVVPGKIAYLPFAGAMQDTSRRDFVVNSATLSAVAQQTVLASLERRLVAPVGVKEAAELLGYSIPAVQNSFRELEYFGIGERVRRKSSRAYQFVFSEAGRGLWEKARPYLASPVRKVVGLASVPKEGCVVAGVDALAALGRLNDQPPTVFATAFDGFAKRGFDVVSAIGAPYLLQLWSYAPQRLGGEGGMDVLSLVLSLSDERDDRVQIEVDRILEEFKW